MSKVYYAVSDRKAEMYSTPFLEITDGTAIRAVQDLVINNKDHHKETYQQLEHCKVEVDLANHL